jgi:hypothetical protein
MAGATLPKPAIRPYGFFAGAAGAVLEGAAGA